jgi:hypothetical protein
MRSSLEPLTPGVGRPGAWFGLVPAIVLGLVLSFLSVVSPLAGIAAACAVGGSVWLANKPLALLLAFVISLAIPVQKSVAGLPINAADALLVLWCVFWPFMTRLESAPSMHGRQVPTVVWAVLPFVGAVALAQIGSISPFASFKQLLRIVEWFVVLPLLLMVFAPSDRFWRFASYMMLAVPCLFAIDGLVEVATNGRSLTAMLGIPVPIPEGDLEQIRHTFDISGRAGSTFGGAQGLAMYLVMTMSVAIAHLVRSPDPALRRFAAVSLAVCGAGLVATQSRGGALGAMALLFVMAVVQRASIRAWMAAAAVALVMVVAMVLALWPGWDGSITSLVPGRPEAVQDRMILWGVVKEVFLDHPFTGVGLGNFRDAFFARETWLNVELGYASVHAHNTYLEVLAGTGLPGLICYLGFLAATATSLLRLWRSGRSGDAVFTLAAIGTLAAYAVFAMVDMLLLQNMHFLLVLILALGLTARDGEAVGCAGPAGRKSPAGDGA